MTEDCHAIESGRSKAISEAKAEAVQRLEAVEREAQRLETIREAANKERRRLLHTRTGTLPCLVNRHCPDILELGDICTVSQTVC